MNDYKNNLNIAYKSSKELIINNEYDEDIDRYLINKLNNLSNISNNYYDKINESYYKLRDFLNKSLYEIDNNLNQCANITYNIFNSEYEKISNKTNTVKTNFTNNKKELNTISYTKKTEHKTNKVKASLFNYREYGEFEFELKVDENKNIKTPVVIGRIINKSRPKKVNLNVSSPYGSCGEIINQMVIEFNDANYTMELISDSKKINVSTYTNFENYKYSTEVFQFGETNETEIIEFDGVVVEVRTKCKKKVDKPLTFKFNTEIDELIENNTQVILG